MIENFLGVTLSTVSFPDNMLTKAEVDGSANPLVSKPAAAQWYLHDPGPIQRSSWIADLSLLGAIFMICLVIYIEYDDIGKLISRFDKIL